MIDKNRPYSLFRYSLLQAILALFVVVLLSPALSTKAQTVVRPANNTHLSNRTTQRQKPLEKKKKSSVSIKKATTLVITTDTIKQKKDTIPFNQEPMFPGGIAELKKFICNNFKYPQEAIDNKVEGQLTLNFSLYRNGKVSNLKTYKAIGSGCEDELKRVMSIMPLWKPRIIRNEAVECNYFDITVTFDDQSTKLEPKNVDVDEEIPLGPIEQNPEFPGGIVNLLDYLSNHIRHNIKAQKLGLYGTVFVQFVVSKTGKVEKTKILRGIGPPCDEEALNAVSKMPNWIPARQNGQPANIMFQIPVKFEVPK